MLLFIVVVLAAVFFEYSNGFHDAANAIATVVSTKVLTPRQAIAMAAVFNLTGALLGGAVASTIGKGLVDTNVVTMSAVLCALISAIFWNLLTWGFGLPSSSSHALIGGICGAALANAHGNWSVLKWNTGLWPKVVIPMITSPLLGLVIGALLMFLLFALLRSSTPHFVHNLFGKMQLLSAAWMAHSHGTNDRAKNDGNYHARALYRHKSGQFRPGAVVARISPHSGFRSGASVGKGALCPNDGCRHRGGRLAHYPHPRPQNGEVAAGPRVRRGDDGRVDHSDSQSLGDSAVDHSCHFDV